MFHNEKMSKKEFTNILCNMIEDDLQEAEIEMFIDYES